jgi:hypothetical protein
MPNGKPAGVPCLHLDEHKRCLIFTDPRRPKVCADFQPMEYICGNSASEAMLIISDLEKDTAMSVSNKEIQ